jgi:DNA-binding transcriptional LysR family regulator
MRTEQLRYFRQVIRAGSFRRAADELGIAQPSLSLSIQTLERQFATRLIERRRGNLQPTATGAAILPFVESLLASEAGIYDELSARTGLYRGEVRLGTVNAGSNTLMPQVLTGFKTTYPGIQLQVTETGSVDILNAVRAGELDLGLIVRVPEQASPNNDLVIEDLLRSTMVVCAHASHPLLSKERVSISDLAHEPLIMFRKGYLMHELLNRLLGQPELNVMYYTDNTESAKRMIAAGVGITVLPEFSLVDDTFRRTEQIVYVPLEGPLTVLSLALIRRRSIEPSRSVSMLSDMLRAQAVIYGEMHQTLARPS